MALFVTNAGEVLLLQKALGVSATENLTLKLYKNTPTFDNSLVAGSFTEMTGQGYAALTLTNTSWSVATNGSNQAEGSYAQQDFVFTGGGPDTIYGYYVVGATSGVLYWAEAFSASHVVQNNGDTIRVTPKITLHNP